MTIIIYFSAAARWISSPLLWAQSIIIYYIYEQHSIIIILFIMLHCSASERLAFLFHSDYGLVPSKTPERPPNVIPYYCIYTLACSITIGETASSVMHSGPHARCCSGSGCFIKWVRQSFSSAHAAAAVELFFLERVTASASAASGPLSIDIIVFAFWSRAAPASVIF